MKAAALIPAYREERFIADVVRRACHELETVLVVDDGSADATGNEARKAGAEVIIHPQNQGKGAAVQTGLRTLLQRDVDYILMLDGDGQHRPEEIPRFLEAAQRTKAKLLVGNRMEQTREMPWARLWTNRIMSAQISLLCAQKVADSQCGFRMIHRKIAPLLLGRAGGFDYETEMLILAAWRGYQIVSVPISTVYGDETSSIHPVRDALRYFELMSRYWVRRWKGERRRLLAASQNGAPA